MDETKAVQSTANTGVQLRRNLGLQNSIGIIVGGVIGSGIFISPKGVFLHVGSIGAALILWILTGLYALLGSISYAEIGSVIPLSGGPYIYTLRSFGSLPGFLSMWISVMYRAPLGHAAVAMAFGNYIIEPFFPLCGQPNAAVKIIALLVIMLTVFINCASIKWAVRFNDALSFTKIVALVVIIITGIAVIIIGYVNGKNSKFQNGFQGTKLNPGNWALGFYACTYSYSGWFSINYISEELKNPNRNLPLAMVISLTLVTITYVLTNVSYFAVLTPELLLESKAAAVTFGQKLFGSMAWTIPVFVALSTLGSLSSGLYASSRLIFVAAREGHLPKSLALVCLRNVTPLTSIVANGIATAVAVIFSDNIFELIKFYSFLDTIVLLVPVMGILHLRRKNPDLRRPVKVHLAVHVLFLMFSITLVILPFCIEPMTTFWGILMALSGLPVYLIAISWKNKPAAVQNFSRKFTVIVQKLSFAAKALNPET